MCCMLGCIQCCCIFLLLQDCCKATHQRLEQRAGAHQAEASEAHAPAAANPQGLPCWAIRGQPWHVSKLLIDLRCNVIVTKAVI